VPPASPSLSAHPELGENVTRVVLLAKAEYYAKMKFPKVGVPLQIGGEWDNERDNIEFQPHIIDSESDNERIGRFLDPVKTEKSAWEEAITFVAKIKENQANRRKYV
jgi:hypothetical protein